MYFSSWLSDSPVLGEAALLPCRILVPYNTAPYPVPFLNIHTFPGHSSSELNKFETNSACIQLFIILLIKNGEGRPLTEWILTSLDCCSDGRKRTLARRGNSKNKKHFLSFVPDLSFFLPLFQNPHLDYF